MVSIDRGSHVDGTKNRKWGAVTLCKGKKWARPDVAVPKRRSVSSCVQVCNHLVGASALHEFLPSVLVQPAHVWVDVFDLYSLRITTACFQFLAGTTEAPIVAQGVFPETASRYVMVHLHRLKYLIPAAFAEPPAPMQDGMPLQM